MLETGTMKKIEESTSGYSAWAYTLLPTSVVKQQAGILTLDLELCPIWRHVG